MQELKFLGADDQDRSRKEEQIAELTSLGNLQLGGSGTSTEIDRERRRMPV